MGGLCPDPMGSLIRGGGGDPFVTSFFFSLIRAHPFIPCSLIKFLVTFADGISDHAPVRGKRSFHGCAAGAFRGAVAPCAAAAATAACAAATRALQPRRSPRRPLRGLYTAAGAAAGARWARRPRRVLAPARERDPPQVLAPARERDPPPHSPLAVGWWGGELVETVDSLARPLRGPHATPRPRWTPRGRWCPPPPPPHPPPLRRAVGRGERRGGLQRRGGLKGVSVRGSETPPRRAS